MASSPIISAFNAGRFSPLLTGRVQFDKYPAALAELLNFIPTVQGPAIKRAGSRYVAPTKDSTKQSWLTTFEYNVTNAYVLEFGDLYIRFFTQHAQLVSGPPVEVATPYAQANLFNADGTCRIRTAQSGDFLYITHGSYEPRTLQRTTATSFNLVEFRPDGGPFKDLNDTTTTVYASGQTGAITLEASAAIFQTGHVGSLFLLEAKDTNSVLAWEPGKAVNIADLRRVGNRVYQALNTATTGTETPVHTVGAYFDGNSGVQWQFSDSGFGWARITGFTSSSLVSATVLSTIPANAVGVPNATTRWAYGAWSSVEGWPTDVTFFRERLVMARGQKVWFSVSSAFNDFSARNTNGEVTADMAISINIASGKINDIQWLLPDKYLLAGTAGAEFSIGELTNGQPLGPGNIRAALQSQFGTRAIIPVQAGASIMFVQRAGRKVREIVYDYSADGYQSFNRTITSEDITSSGVVDMDYAQEPYSIVWCTMTDGSLAGFTWNAEQNVWCWHKHQIGGDGVVESVACIPSPDQSRNELWLIVRRTIDGQTARYVEFMEAEWMPEQSQDQAFYVDSGLTYTGAPTLVISGLDHLEGETVTILVDGSTHPDRTVESGSITLQREGSVVSVGLSYEAKLLTMRLEAGSRNGTAQGKIKRIHKVAYRFLNSSSGKFGPSFDNLSDFTFRVPDDPMSEPVPPFTGDKLEDWPGGYETDGQMAFYDKLPLPVTLVALMPQVTVSDAR